MATYVTDSSLHYLQARLLLQLLLLFNCTGDKKAEEVLSASGG